MDYELWHLHITCTFLTCYLQKQQQQCTQKSCLTKGATPSKMSNNGCSEATKGYEKTYRK